MGKFRPAYGTRVVYLVSSLIPIVASDHAIIRIQRLYANIYLAGKPGIWPAGATLVSLTLHPTCKFRLSALVWLVLSLLLTWQLVVFIKLDDCATPNHFNRNQLNLFIVTDNSHIAKLNCRLFDIWDWMAANLYNLTIILIIIISLTMIMQ